MKNGIENMVMSQERNVGSYGVIMLPKYKHCRLLELSQVYENWVGNMVTSLERDVLAMTS